MSHRQRMNVQYQSGGTNSKSYSSVQGSYVPAEGLFCRYSHRVCMQNRLDGYEYCIKHILEDPNAPFKQCNYISNKTGKRCINAAARLERKDGYCVEHTRRTILLRQKASRKRKPQQTPQTLFHELEQSYHHGAGSDVRRTRNVENLASRVLDYASSSGSDSEGLTVEQTWHGDGDSDAESVDSEQEDPLKHAGIYTAEEVALITRDKLIRLQSLYIDQFKRLQHLLGEKRRKYFHFQAADREHFGSITPSSDDPEQRDLYDKLKSLKRYHKRYGKEALLHRQSQERRKQISEGVNYSPPSYPKCSYQTETAGRCGERTVPLSKYCTQHILEDQFQVLFRNCNYGNVCQKPVAALKDENSRCAFHTELQSHQHRLPTKQTSEDSCQSSQDGDHKSNINCQVAMVTGQLPHTTVGLVTNDQSKPSGEPVEEQDNLDLVTGNHDPASEGDSEETTTASEKTDS